jgi:hypothetical protein
VAACPLNYTSRNSPKVRDVLGTVVLGILAGHWRYAHLTALRGDTVSAERLGMSRVVSEDAVRRGLSKIDEKDGAEWLCRHLRDKVSPLLKEPWILDCDTTVKPLYGHQEGAVVGHNPHKPGRPSHAYHSFQISSVRLILDVMVVPGNQHTSKHSEPHIGSYLISYPGTIGRLLSVATRAGAMSATWRVASKKVCRIYLNCALPKASGRTIEKMVTAGGWVDAGKGWDGQETTLRLQG